MKSKAAVKRIMETLKSLYPDALCSLRYDKDYELLFAVRLSAQCTDERVNQVTPALFARFPTLESFAQADPQEVGQYIHSCGHPHHRPAGHHGRVQGPPPGGAPAAPEHPAQRIQ